MKKTLSVPIVTHPQVLYSCAFSIVFAFLTENLSEISSIPDPNQVLACLGLQPGENGVRFFFFFFNLNY